MPVQQMRDFLKKQYRYADKWVKRVDAMSDGQILAIYFRMYGESKK